MLGIKKIDWYIFKKYMVWFFSSMLFLIGIVIIFDISEKIDGFVANEAPLKDIVFFYYVNFIPYFMNMFSPLFVFLTVIMFTSRMAANSEIIAILSCGVSYRRMMVPYIAGAICIGLMSLLLNLFVIPKANVTRIAFEDRYVKQNTNYRRRDIHYQIAPGQFVYVDSYSAWNNTAYRFTLETIKDNKLVSKLSAETAIWDTSFDGWRMRKYHIRDYSGGLGDVVRTGDQLDTVLALTVKDFYQNDKTVETLDIRQLNDLIDTQVMRGDANVMYAQIEKNTRFALPFSALILTIMGVALSSRKRRGGIGWNLGIGIALAFSYILFMRFSQMFVFTGTLSPSLALWLPNMLYAAIAAVLYRLAPK